MTGKQLRRDMLGFTVSEGDTNISRVRPYFLAKASQPPPDYILAFIMTNGAPESAHQPTQRLFGSYYASIPYLIEILVTVHGHTDGS
jgi:hypothetical protein